MTDLTKGSIQAVLSALALSTMGILGKMLFANGVHPLNVVMLRAILAFVTLGLVLRVIRGEWPLPQRKDLVLFVVLGFIGITLNYTSFFLALDFTTVSTAIMLLYTYPIFVVFGGVILFNEPLTKAKITALLFAILGCILITKAYDIDALGLNAWGIFFGFLASITKAIYTLLGKKALSRYDPWSTVLFAFGFGALFLILIVVPSGFANLSISLQSWVLVLAIAVVPTLIGYSLFVLALKSLEAGQASLIATLEPVAAVVLAYLILGENLTYPQMAGMTLVIMGIWLLNRTYKRASSEPES